MASAVTSAASTAIMSTLPLMVSRRNARSDRTPIFSERLTEGRLKGRNNIHFRLVGARDGDHGGSWKLMSTLAIDPVRQLHEEAVIGPQIEQIAQVALEALRSLETGEPAPPLTPHDEERGSGPVLPAVDHIGAELLEVEPADVVRVCRVTVRLIAARVVRGPRRG